MFHRLKTWIKARLIERLQIGQSTQSQLLIPPGHYYSPIPDLNEIRASDDRIFADDLPDQCGIDLNLDGQIDLLPKLSEYAMTAHFPEEKEDGFRFYHHNPNIDHVDSLTLHAMLRHFRPKRVIEVGSGFSSAMMLDTNEKYLNNETSFTFIEPYPALFSSLIKETDHVRLIPKKLQDVPLSEFEQLEAGDFLYIDSTHVSKIGSDVNYNIFQILPHLKEGVFVHFHDILWPFEYPRVWIYDVGYYWTEAYLLRAFLEFNETYQIQFWPPCLGKKRPVEMQKYYDIADVPSGGSIWLKRVR